MTRNPAAFSRCIAPPVAFERWPRRVVGEPVDLDDQPLLPPQEVDLVAEDADVRLRVRKPRAADEWEQWSTERDARDTRAVSRRYPARVSAARVGGIVGESEALQTVLQQIELVADTDATVLITGESGTGKELVARAIHERSHRRQGPLVRVNCAALPESLFESELFGYVRGAFTGAVNDRTGRFEAAAGGKDFVVVPAAAGA